MINLKPLFSLSAASAALFVLAGCVTSENPSSGGSDISVSNTVEVLAIEQPTGSAPGTIVTREVYAYCEEGELVTETDTSTANYTISGGNLFVWEDGECLMMKLTGTSSTIIGTWKGSTMNPTDSVPANLRSTMCYDQIDDNESGMFEDLSVEYKISTTQINSKMSAKVCYARIFSASFDETEEDTPAFEIVSEDCSTVKIKNLAENKTATITSGYKGDSASLKFTYDGTVCTGSIYLGLTNDNPTSCSNDDGQEEGGSFQNFATCMGGSGFYGDISMEKRQSLTKSLSKAAKPVSGGPF